MGDKAGVATNPYPELGEEFELTLDGDHPDNQPTAMKRGDGNDGWTYRGDSTVRGIVTKRFKLMKFGYRKEPGFVRREYAGHGTVPEGQWRQAFIATFPTHDGKGPVGIPDSSWQLGAGGYYFPCVNKEGIADFYWGGHGLDKEWRWLVCVGE